MISKKFHFSFGHKDSILITAPSAETTILRKYIEAIRLDSRIRSDRGFPVEKQNMNTQGI